MSEKISEKTTTTVPKVQLYMPLSWWSHIMVTLDRKIASLAGVYGFGSIRMDVVVREGKVKDVVFTDEARIRQDNKTVKKEIT